MEAIIIILCSIVIVLVLKTVDSIWWKPRRIEKELRRQGLKGNSYKFFYGDKKDMSRLAMDACSRPISLNHKIAPRVLPFFHHMVQKYGKISLSWNQTTPRLIIEDAEVIRLILNNKEGHFLKPKLNPLINLLSLGLNTLEGQKWAKRRKLISPAFHHDKLKGMIPAFSTSCSNMVEEWKKLVTPKGFCEIDVSPEFQKLASDVISRTAFGSSYEEGNKVFELQKQQILLVLEAAQNIYIPGLRFLPTKKNRMRYKIDKEIKSILREIIHKKEKSMQNKNGNNEDLLALLLKCKAEEENDMTINDLIEECKLFYFAGQETTATLLTWTCIALSMNPVWQDKAREEVLRICGKSVPDIESINRFNVISMILNEVLRLYPPVTALFRSTRKTTNIGGMTIPAGVNLLLQILLMHHDPDYWGDDADEFKPERFSEGVSKASKDGLAFYPFGWGPRFCLGQAFAMIEAKMAMAMVLQHFWFELSPSYTHAPRTFVTVQPQYGAPIVLHQL